MREPNPFPIEEMSLIPKENNRVLELVERINLKDQHQLANYGLQAQESLASFSDKMLEQIQSKSVEDTGAVISELLELLGEINPRDLKGSSQSFWYRLFHPSSVTNQEVTSRFNKASVQVDRLMIKLERNKNILISDNIILDRLFDKNKSYYESLNLYITAAEQKLMLLPAQPDIIQLESDEWNTEVDYKEVLERRIYDLKISKEVSKQSAIQIRMIQNTNQTLVQKIQSIVHNSIPLWKNQLTIALTLIRKGEARSIEEDINNLTELQANLQSELSETKQATQKPTMEGV